MEKHSTDCEGLTGSMWQRESNPCASLSLFSSPVTITKFPSMLLSRFSLYSFWTCQWLLVLEALIRSFDTTSPQHSPFKTHCLFNVISNFSPWTCTEHDCRLSLTLAEPLGSGWGASATMIDSQMTWCCKCAHVRTNTDTVLGWLFRNEVWGILPPFRASLITFECTGQFETNVTEQKASKSSLCVLHGNWWPSRREVGIC